MDPIIIHVGNTPKVTTILTACGPAGREIELQVYNNMLQWRYVGDATWIDLIELPNGSQTQITAIAAEAIGGQRIVSLNSDGKAIYPTDYSSAIGITTGAVELGATATIITSGQITETSWSWTPNMPLFLSDNGLMTQTAPVTGELVQIGWAITSTTIFLKINPIIQLL